VAVGIWVVATRSLPPPSPPTGKASGFCESIGWFYDAAFAKFMVPLQWYVDTTSPMGNKGFEVWTRCCTGLSIRDQGDRNLEKVEPLARSSNAKSY
jgi:hypothetical protein